MAPMLARAFKSLISAVAYCFYFQFRGDHNIPHEHHNKHKGHSHHNHYKYTMSKGRPLALQTVELRVRMCCSGCERVVKNAIYKLGGVHRVEVNLELEKVTVEGYVDRNKVLKAVRRAGKRAEFWPYPNPPLYFISANHYFRDTTSEFKESYNYYKHGYNQADRHGNIHVTHRGDDRVSNMFNDDDVNACCLM